MVYPIVPLFLTGTLGAPLVAVGLIEGVAESTASILKLAGGWLSDRVRRRLPFAFAGYSLAAVAKPALAAAVAWPMVLGVRFVDRAGKGIRNAPRDALIAASSAPENLGRAFGLHRTMDTTGAIAGPLIAIALLLWLGDNYRPIFLLAFIPGALSVIALLQVRETVTTVPQRTRDAILSLRGYDPRFLTFLGVSLLFALGNSSDAFLILRAHDIGLSATAVVLAYVVYNISYAALAFPAGIVSDRIGRRPLLAIGFLVFAGVYAGFAAVGDEWSVWPLFAIYGAYIALTEGIGRAYISDLVPEDRRASAIGLYGASTGAMLLIASIIGGALWDLVGPQATFAFGAGTASLAAIVFLGTSR
ncbi:MAG: MFS transporter [Chloroflexi bacterium]|nr:MFS transporter [Chloroflexota bacterium]